MTTAIASPWHAFAAIGILTWTGGTRVSAASPATIQQGRQLFQHEWSVGDPSFGSDGLGPLFNARSCVACHHQGGVGGAGDSRFNAQSIGIERIEFSGPGVVRRSRRARGVGGSMLPRISRDRKIQLLGSFFPGFVRSGSIKNTAPLPHHGGNSGYVALRERILAHANVVRSRHGGPVSGAEVRVSTDAPILFHHQINGATVTLTARLFQRNPTSLFGAGLIDTVDESAISEQIQLQSQHPEVSGRASLLRDGSLGRFGWRANASRLISFVDSASANELSLETKRRQQMIDPSRPSYRNPAVDIRDDQIESITDFIAALPRPIQQLPTDAEDVARVQQGRKAFTIVGCAVCHAPDLGGVAGIYSDLLLHDMGPQLYDYDAAEPHVISQQLTREARVVPGTEVTSYYGSASSIGTGISIPDRFESPRASTATRDYVTVAEGDRLGRHALGSSVTAELRDEIGIRRRLKPSNTSQEWRTPPLWGVRDSAPYMHNGSAETLLESISMHGGEASGSRDRFLQLPLADRHALIAFLETLVAPPDALQPDP